MSAVMANIRERLDPAVATAFVCIILLLLVGSINEPNFLSLDYLLKQVQVASFLGIIATGAMIVILLGHIDLSIPWVVTVGGMMATGAIQFLGPDLGVALAIPFAIFCGAAIGVVNGVGVAYLRVPSMIFTLGMNAVAQGLMVLHTGGFAPQDRATEAMHFIAVQRTILGIPNAAFVWLVVGLATVFVLSRTTLGRHIYAIGNRERAAFLSGVNTRRVLLICFGISGGCAALGGVMLAGYSAKSYQAMGDAYLLPAIAAVVLGGANILGGRGSYIGTVAGVILITLLESILRVMQMDESFRQIIYGAVIVLMLLLYGREKASR